MRSPTVDLDGLDFSGALGRVKSGLVVAPLFRNYVEQARELSFPALAAKDLGARAPDGWFHPSTHPLWSPAALYQYLANPGGVLLEHLSYESRLSVLFGAAWHGFMQRLLRKATILVAPRPCLVCPPAARCKEASFVDEETGARGHVDGEIDPALTPVPALWEGKTTAENTWPAIRRLKDLEDLDLESFRRIWPDYHAQAVEYMRISGYRLVVLSLAILGNPWDVREFHIPYDEELAERTAAKYRRVRQAVADRRPIGCACDRNEERKCPARKVCP